MSHNESSQSSDYSGQTPVREGHSRYARLFRDALREADEPEYSADSCGQRNAIFESELAALRHEINIRCPHCRTRVAFDDDTPPNELACDSCGHRFSIIDDDQVQAATALTQQAIARFELLQRVGCGGFGSVWKAYDADLDRTVAVKIPHRVALKTEDIDQVLREAQASAQLNHPNIVHVYEVGRDDDCLFIVSDFVEGVPLSKWLQSHRPTFREAADLCAKVADALQHAHDNGVIHRDLKPQNIIVDTDGDPHLLDFGLARRDAGQTTVTLDGHVIGTPAYMSPEQARGEAHQADRRTDIYSLGVILFEMLTAELPFRGSAHMILQQVVEEEPPSLRKLNGSVPKDLETVCLKCLEKLPSKRYGSARSLADEFRRYLTGRPILARPIPRLARAWRWCKRNPMTAALFSMVLVVAIVAPSIAVSQAALRHQAETVSVEMYRNLYARDMQRGLVAWHNGQITEALRIHQKYAFLPANQPELRGFEYRYLTQSIQDAANVPRLRHDLPVASVTYSLDGTTLAVAAGSQVHLWDAPRGARLQILDTQDDRPVNYICFSPIDANELVCAAGNRVAIWDVRTGSRVTLCEHEHPITRVAFSPDGQELAIGDQGGFISLWATDSLEQLAFQDLSDLSKGMRVLAISFSPDGETIATSVREGGVSLLNAKNLRRLDKFRLQTAMALEVVFAEDGNTLVLFGADSLITFWDLARRRQIASVVGHAAPIASAVNAPRAKVVATASRDGTIRFWNTETKQHTTTLRGHTSGVTSAAFTPDGKTLASGSLDGEVLLWPIGGDATCELMVHGQMLTGVSVSADGSLIASASVHNTLKLWDAASGSLRHSQSLHEKLWNVTFTPGGKALALGTDQGVRFWDAMTWQDKGHLQGSELRNVVCMTYSPNGKQFAAANWGGKIEIWDVDSRVLIARLDGYQAEYGGLAFSPNGRMLAIPRTNDRIDIWDVDAQKVTFGLPFAVSESTRREFKGDLKSGKMVKCVAFSPDGRMLAAATWDGRIILWNILMRKHHVTIAADQERILHSVAFTPDGATLVSGGSDGTIKLWSLAVEGKPREMGALYGHVAPVIALAFFDEGRTLISAGYDTTIRLWRASSARLQRELRSQAQQIQRKVGAL